MSGFKKRTYSVSAFLCDVAAVLRHPRLALGVAVGDSLRPRFRERLYLAVIAVNRCRHCSYFHTKTALQSGLSRVEIARLLQGVTGDVPSEEAPAIFYAQHWAASDGKPEPKERAALLAAYSETWRAIEMALLLIRIGSLSGNSVDSVLFRISGGRLGGEKR